jgi:ribosome-interacting GTPase 1
MPINASLEYYQAEEEYHEAKTKEQKLKTLKKLLATAPTHKGAQKLRSQIKQKISKLKEAKAPVVSKGRKSLSVKKEGAAQVVFVGCPSSGKSYILEKLSGKPVEQKDYPFSTKVPEIRMIDIGGAKIQGVEVPAIYEGFYEKDNGPEVFAIVRNADFVVLVIDGREDVKKQIAMLHSEFGNADIELTKERRGKQGLTTFIPTLILVNYKPDFSGGLDVINYKDSKINEVISTIWARLPIIRIHTKTGGVVAKKPIVMKKNSTVKDVAEKVHKDFVANFKYAKIWGSGSFPGQQVGMDYVLKDKDVVELYVN